MLRESNMPAALVEGGYMSSTTDIVKLRDNAVLKTLVLEQLQQLQLTEILLVKQAQKLTL